MKRRQPVVGPTVDDVPECLRAGPCIEVWAPNKVGTGLDAPHWEARRAYKSALDLWRKQQGIGPHEHNRLPDEFRRSTRPWSYAFLAGDPDRLQQQLRYRGLPPDWQPRPAPAEWRSS